MSISWASVKKSVLVDENSPDNHQGDDTLERRIADLRQKYESAIRKLNEMDLPDIPHDLFLLIIDEISPQDSSNSELGRIQYLSLKNHSQLLEMQGKNDEALEYALRAHAILVETSLLFNICKLSIKTGDTWTTKALLHTCRDFNERDLLPVALLRLRKDMKQIEKVNRMEYQKSIRDDIAESWLTARPIHTLSDISKPWSNGADSSDCLDMPLASTIGLGDRVAIYWPDDKKWYDGIIEGVDTSRLLHKIRYDDGVVENLCLPHEIYRLLERNSVRTIPVAQSPTTSVSTPSKLDTIVRDAMDDCELANRNDRQLLKELAGDAPPVVLDFPAEAPSSSHFHENNNGCIEQQIGGYICLVARCNSRCFNSKRALRDHMRLHDGEAIPNDILRQMEFEKCDICGGYFSILGNGLYVHAKLKHADRLDEFSLHEWTESAPIIVEQVATTEPPASPTTTKTQSTVETSTRRASSRLKKELEIKLTEKVVEDSSFGSRVMNLLDGLIPTSSSSSRRIKTVLDVLMYIECSDVQERDASNMLSHSRPHGYQVIEFGDYISYLQFNYPNEYQSSYRNQEALIFSMAAKEITKFIKCSEMSTDTSAFFFPAPDTLSHLIIGFASKFLTRSTLALQSLLSTDEALTIFECFVDVLTSDIYSVEAARMFGLDERNILSFLVQFLLARTAGLFAEESGSQGYRLSWALSLIIRCKKLSSLLDIHRFVDHVRLALHRLRTKVIPRVNILLPHVRNNTSNVINNSAITAALEQVNNHNEICNLELEMQITERSLEDQTDWLKKAVAVLREVGDPLLIWGGRISTSIVGHTMRIANKLQQKDVLSDLHAKLTLSLFSKYKLTHVLWDSLVLEICKFLITCLQGLDSNDVETIRSKSFLHMKGIWLLAFRRGNKEIFDLLSEYMSTFVWTPNESFYDTFLTLETIIVEIAIGISGKRIEYLMPLLPVLTIHLADTRHKFNLDYNVVYSLVSYLQEHLSHNGKSRKLDNSQELNYLNGIYLLLSTSDCMVDDDSNACYFLSLCYEMYSNRMLYTLDDGAFGLRISTRLMPLLLDTNDISRGIMFSTRNPKYSKEKIIISTLSLLYNDYYGIPFLSTIASEAHEKGSFRRDITANVLSDIYNFVKFRQFSGSIAKNELRFVFKFLSKQPLLRELPICESVQLVEGLIFGPGAVELHRLESYLLSSLANTEVPAETPIWSRTACVEDIQRKFYHDILEIGVLEASISDNGILSRIHNADSRSLPFIDALLKDVALNPTHSDSWLELLNELVSLYFAVQDTLGEICIPVNLPHELHEYDGTMSLRACLTATGFSYLSSDLIPMLCIRKNVLFQVIMRIGECIEVVFRVLRSHDEDTEDLVDIVYETLANLLYNTSLQHPKHSSSRISLATRSLSYFVLTVSRKASLGEAAFSYLMAGKLTWQLHKDVFKALDYFDLASKQDASFVGNKVLKLGLLYQVHSLRIKVALSLAAVKNPEENSGDVLARLEESSFDQLSVEQTRVQAVITDACRALRECRRLDVFDFKSVYRIANIAYQICTTPALAGIHLPGMNEGMYGALEEISKLFDKKRQQIVAIWCEQSTSNRFEQLIQRTYKYDSLRRKYIDLYVTLLNETSSFEKLIELILMSVGIKGKTASIDDLIACVLRRFFYKIELEYHKRCEVDINSDMSELLAYLYEIYTKCKSYITGKDDLLVRFKGLMVQLFRPCQLEENYIRPSITFDGMNIRKISQISCFTSISFDVVREYCSKRWNDDFFRRQQLLRQPSSKRPRTMTKEVDKPEDAASIRDEVLHEDEGKSSKKTKEDNECIVVDSEMS